MDHVRIERSPEAVARRAAQLGMTVAEYEAELQRIGDAERARMRREDERAAARRARIAPAAARDITSGAIMRERVQTIQRELPLRHPVDDVDGLARVDELAETLALDGWRLARRVWRMGRGQVLLEFVRSVR